METKVILLIIVYLILGILGSILFLRDIYRTYGELTLGDVITFLVVTLTGPITLLTGKVWNIGKRYKKIKTAQPIEQILVKDSTFISSDKLRKRLLKEQIKEYKCECCNNSLWLNQKIPLELHHINGDKHNNRIENLQLLCPNCHALTDNYRGKNIKQVA